MCEKKLNANKNMILLPVLSPIYATFLFAQKWNVFSQQKII